MKRILLIDDSLIQHRIMQTMLKGSYELLTSTSGLDGIRIAKTEQPDLILLDYNMPIMSGRETFRMLQEKEETKGIPVVFLTGVNERRDVGAVLKLRPQGYLLKPVEQSGLLQVIEKVLSEERQLAVSQDEVIEPVHEFRMEEAPDTPAQDEEAKDELFERIDQLLSDGNLFAADDE